MERDDVPNTGDPGSLLFLSSEEERMACLTQLVISFMSSLRLAEISPMWKSGKEAEGGKVTTVLAEAAAETARLSRSSRCCEDSELSHCSYEEAWTCRQGAPFCAGSEALLRSCSMRRTVGGL